METSAHAWESGILVHPLSVTPVPVSHSGAAAVSVTFDLVYTSTPSITTFLPGAVAYLPWLSASQARSSNFVCTKLRTLILATTRRADHAAAFSVPVAGRAQTVT